MALTSYEEIKNQILETWDWLVDNNYPYDHLDALADSCCPVYHADIIKEWQEMPSEYDNRWQDGGLSSDRLAEITITGLMNIDLWHYYRDQFYAAYREILEFEKENA